MENGHASDELYRSSQESLTGDDERNDADPREKTDTTQMVNTRTTLTSKYESLGGDSSALRTANFSVAQDELMNDLSDYTRRIETASQNQHNYAALIAALENKVLDYRRRFHELEERMLNESRGKLDLSDEEDGVNFLAPTTSTPVKPHGLTPPTLPASLNNSETDVLTALESEKQRVITQQELNSMLREQLDSASKVNDSLLTDVQRVNLDNERLKRDLRLREEKWRERDKALKAHFTEEHRQLLSLWSALQTLKHQQIDLKNATQRDLASIKTDFHRTYKQLVGACKSLGISQLAQSLLDCGESGPSMDWLMKVDASGSMDPVLVDKLKKLVDSQREITATSNLLKEKNEKLVGDAERLEDELSRKDSEMERLKEDCQRLERDNKAWDEKLKKLTRNAELRQSELLRKNESLDAALKESQAKLERCAEDAAERGSDLERSTQLVQSLERDKIVLQRYHREREDLDRKISTMTKRISELNVECSKAKTESNSLQESLRRAQEETRTSKSHSSTLQSRLKEVELDGQQWKSDLEWLQSEKAKEVESEIQKSVLAVQKLETEKKRLEIESTSLWGKLKAAEENRRSMERKIAELQSDLGDSKEGIKSAQEKLRVAQNLVMSYEEKMRGQSEEIKSIKSRMAHLESECRGKESQVKDLNENVRTVKSQRDTLEWEVSRLREAEETEERERGNRDSEIQAQRTEIQGLKTHLSEMKQKKQEAELKLNRKVEEVRQNEEAEGTWKSTVERLRSTLSRSEETEQRLRAQIDILNTRSESEQREWREELESTKGKLEEVSSTSSHAHKELAAAKSSVNEWKRRLAEESSRLSQAEGELGRLKEEKIKLETEVAGLVKSLKTMDLSEQELRKRAGGLEAEEKEAKARERQLQRQIEKLLSQNDEWTRKQERWDREKSSLYLTIEGLEEENQKAEASFRETSMERQALHKSLEALERENISLHKELQKLKTQIAQLETGHTKKFVESLKQNRILHENQVERLKSETREMRISLEHYRSKCKGLEEQLRVVREQLQEENQKVQNFCDSGFRHAQEVAEIRTDMNRSIQNSSLGILDSYLTAPGRNRSRRSQEGGISPFLTPVKQK